MMKKRLYIKAIRKWHTTSQIHMAIEECGELIVVLTKHFRNNGSSNMDDILEEMADVEIMLEQLKIIFNYTYSNGAVDKFNDIKRRKLERLEKRLNEA